jgi:methyltransferase-like protein
MSWTLEKDTLFDHKSEEIGYFLPTASETEKLMMQNSDDLIELVCDFTINYDEGKKQVSKKLFDKLKRYIDTGANYKVIWKVNSLGEVTNENDQTICILVNPDSYVTKRVMSLPELYDACQVLLNSLSKTNGIALKKIYNRICDFYDKN